MQHQSKRLRTRGVTLPPRVTGKAQFSLLATLSLGHRTFRLRGIQPHARGAGVYMVDSQTYDMLLRRYDSTCLPLEIVRQHYLPHLSTPALLRALGKETLSLRVVSGDWGGRMQRVVYLHDLASWLDQGGN